jgi:hypothetical protein
MRNDLRAAPAAAAAAAADNHPKQREQHRLSYVTEAGDPGPLTRPFTCKVGGRDNTIILTRHSVGIDKPRA